MSVTGSTRLSTQDDVAAALADRGLQVFAYHGATDEEYMIAADTMDILGK